MIHRQEPQEQRRLCSLPPFMGMDHTAVCKLIGDLAAEDERRGLSVTHSFDFGDELRITTFRKPAGYTMVKLNKAPQPDIGTFIQIAGGGAVNAPINSDLCRAIFNRHINMDWGGPFVRSWPNGTMTYGSQMVLPGEALAMDANGVGFLAAMIGLLGEMAYSIAVELVPRFGGNLLDGSGANDENEFFVALVGTGPPDAL